MWRGGPMGRYGVIVFYAVLLSACSTTPSSSGSSATEQPAPDPNTTGASASTVITATDTECDIPPGQPLQEGASVKLVELGTVNDATVSGAIYPHPAYEGDPWSQWGQGIALDDGRFYSAIGDHIGPDGNSYIYEYDPKTNELVLVGDILSYVEHVPGTWGYGKIHSQMVPGPCGAIYFSTYWGTFRGLDFRGNYTGDVIFRLNPNGRTLQPLGVPVEFHGQASMGSDPRKGLLYSVAVDPIERATGGPPGPFFAYDVESETTVFTSEISTEVGYYSVLVDQDGVAYWSIGGGQLQRFHPDSGETTIHDFLMPGDWLSAASWPAADGSVFGATREPNTLFVLDHETGEITKLGDTQGYVASLALASDGSSFFYMPGAHGQSSTLGAPLIEVDTATGERTVVAELNDLVTSELGFKVGGTYNIAVSPGGRVFMGVNASLPDGNGFGEVILLVIDLQ